MSIRVTISSLERGKIRVTGAKAQDKKYYRHTGYPGGIYETNFTKLQQRFPCACSEKPSGHAAQGAAWLCDAEENEVLCRHSTPARCPAAQGSRVLTGAIDGCDLQLRYGSSQNCGCSCFYQAGLGNIVVNGKPLDQFFSRETGRMVVVSRLL